MGGWLGGSVGQWVGSGQMTNNLINLDLIDIERVLQERVTTLDHLYLPNQY